MFETFWQGRLVPQGRAAPLPFMETAALRNRSAAARDELPDAALGRVRGCLFFGPSWKVTRNKLSFRDDLPKLLLESEPLERNLDKKFREWLTRCHAELDRSITYERALPAAEQAAARRTHGEASTVFERCVGALPSDRSAAVRRGDLLWLRVGKGANAQIAARCAGFLVPQAVKTDGPYPGGRVLAVRLPELIHGSQPAPHAVGRILAACSEQQAAEAAEKELSRAPARVKVEEPLSFTGGQVVLTAGAPVPEITAKVLTATGQPVTRTVLGGNKVALTLVQTLVYLGPEPKEVEGGEGGAAAATAGDGEPAAADDGVAPMEEDGAAAAENGGGGGGKGGKRGAGGAKRKTPAKDAELRDVSNLPEEAGEAEAEGAAAGGKPRKKAKSGAATAAAEQQQQQAEAEEAAAAAAAAKGKGKGKGKKAAALLAAAEQAADPRQVITQVRNSTPGGQSYAFRRFDTGSDCATPALGRAGRYALEFHVAEAPFVPVLSISIAVKPGAPASFALEGSFGSASATAAAAQAAHAAGDSASQEARRGVGASSEDVGGMVTTAAATAPAGRLGSPLGDLAMRFFDAHGNAIERLGKPRPVVNMNVRPVAGNCDVEAVARGSAKGGSMMRLFGFRIEGAIEGDGAEGAAAAAEAKPLGLFSSPQPAARGRKGAAAAAGSLPVAQVLVTVGCDNMDVAVTFVQPLCPGVPARLVALPPSAAAAERPRRGGGHHAAAAADGSDGAVTVGPGGALSLVAGTSGLLPAVHVSCFDRWGHPTWPSGPAGPIRSAAVASGEPEWTVVATCAAAEPKEAVLPIDPATGIASTEGIFRAPPEPTAEGSPVEMTFRVVPGAAASEADAEAISAVPHATAALTVEPSRDPTFLLLLRDGAALPRSSLPPETENAPPKSLVLLDGLLAGSVLSGLTVLLTDSACQPVPRPVRGRLTVGWASGSKRLALGGGAAAAGGDGGVADGVAVTLPNLAVPREAGREHELAVSFLVESGGALLETIVRIVPAAGPPHAWTLSVVDRASEQEGAASSSQASQGGSGIRAGVPFTVVVEAHDEHGSRARRPSASGGPNPRLEVAGARPLQLRMLDAGQWADAPGGGETWTARAVVEGGAGEATLTVKDATPAAPAADPSAAPFDAALAQPQGNPLKQDSVRFELLPGPPAALAFVGGARINTSTRAVLRDLTVVAVDQWGSQTALPTGGGGVDVKLESVAVGLPAEPDPFDSGKESMEGDDADALMALPRNPAAAGADGDGEDGAAGGGSAEPAAVAPVSGAAKKRLGDDGACFGAVRFCAPRPGSFILRATATARKGYAGPPLTDAQATVHAKASNRVTAVRLAPSGSLPAAAATDGGGAAANGPCLSLRVGAGECCAVDVFLGTEDTLPPPSRDAVEGLSVWLSAPGGASKVPLAKAGKASGGRFPFRSPPLTSAGSYALFAEYAESREALAGALSAEEAAVAAQQGAVEVAAGLPAALRLSPPPPECLVACSLAEAPEAKRQLLGDSVVILVDAHGNNCSDTAAVAGDSGGERMAVRASVQWLSADGTADGSADPPEGGELPSLSVSSSERARGGGGATSGASLSRPVDGFGRARFGALSLAKGTGRAPPDSDGAANCVLVFELVNAPEAFSSVPPLVLEVAFTDDAEAGDRTQLLADKAGRLAQRRGALTGELADAERAVQRAKAASQEAAKHTALLRDRLSSAAAGALAKRPAVAEIEERLREVAAGKAQQDAAQQQAPPPRRAKFGRPESSTTRALHYCLQKNRPFSADVVGAAVELAYADDEGLVKTLSWILGMRLQTVVVTTAEAMLALRDELRRGDWARSNICQLVAMEHLSADRRGPLSVEQACKRYGCPTERPEVSARRREWLTAASAGTDDLISIPLPHEMQGGRASGSEVGAAGGGGGGGGGRRGGGDRGANPAVPAPEGLIAHAVNLLRPAHAGHRRTLWTALFGDLVIFDTLANASAYRSACIAQKLKCPGLVTLDGSKLYANGILDGTVAPERLEAMEHHFGGVPPAERPRGGAAEDAEGALRALLEAARRAEEAVEAYQGAKTALEMAKSAAEPELATLEGEIARVKEKLRGAQQQQGAAGAGGGAGGKAAGAKRKQAAGSRRRSGGGAAAEDGEHGAAAGGDAEEEEAEEPRQHAPAKEQRAGGRKGRKDKGAAAAADDAGDGDAEQQEEEPPAAGGKRRKTTGGGHR